MIEFKMWFTPPRNPSSSISKVLLSSLYLTFNNINLLTASTEASDGFTKVLGEDLECAIGLFAADEYLADYSNFN